MATIIRARPRLAAIAQPASQPFALPLFLSLSTAAPLRPRAPIPSCQERRRGYAARPVAAPKIARMNAPTAASQMQKKLLAFSSSDITTSLPGVFVSPPLRKYLFQPVTLARLIWNRLYTHAKDYGILFFFKMASKPSFFKPARYKVGRGSTLAAAKALHRTMCESLARGDTDALHKILARPLYLKLCGAIELRPRTRRYEWELVRYNRRLTHPRIVDHKIARLDALGEALPPVEQAVVAIASRQRLTEYDGDRVVASRETDVLENVILVSTIDETTWQPRDWRIFGHAPETTLEEWDEERRALRELEQEEMHKKLHAPVSSTPQSRR